MTPTTQLVSGASLNGTSFTVSQDAGLLAGDLRLVFADTANTTISAGSGWTQHYGGAIATSRNTYCFYDIHDPASPASTSFTLAATNNYGWVHVAVRGCDRTDPFNLAGNVASNATAGTTANTPDMVTDIAGCLLLGWFTVFTNSASASISTPTGMASVGGQNGNGTNGHAVKLFSEARPAPGATGVRNSTITSSPWGALAVVISPTRTDRLMPFFM